MKNLTKSNFLIYLDAPMHLWASIHNKFEKSLSVYEQHLLHEGYKVEKLAKEYLENFVKQNPQYKLIWQKTYTDKNYEVKTDTLLHHIESDTYDIYEIKSSTSVDKINIKDVTFQYLVLNKNIKINKIHILHLNKKYLRFGKLNINSLFVAEDITGKVKELLEEIDIEREKAIMVLNEPNHFNIQPCYNIKTCRCMSLCHDNLPAFSIFNIPNLTKKKKQELLDLDIIQAQDIPDNFKLSYKQSLVREVAKTNTPIIANKSINHELERLSFPLYFLDYETYNSAIPLHDAYHAQQQMVFQYSLHTLEHLDSELKHSEYIATNNNEPSLELIKQMRKDIGDTGSVIVWNKTFESTRNKELAEIHPEYAEFLLDMNERMYDLADSIKEGYYVHPQFKGSWSIKNVLPVMVPNLSYKNLTVNKGDQAMITWWNMINNQDTSADEIKNDLLEYCKLDTLAMVEIYKGLREIIR
jgi:hypothetical protein